MRAMITELRQIERAVELGVIPRAIETEIRKLVRESKQLRGQIRAAQAVYHSESDLTKRAYVMWLCLKDSDNEDTGL